MFALPISMPRFKSIIFYQNKPKIKLFLQKNAKFSSAGASAPSAPGPQASDGWGLRPQTPHGFRRLEAPPTKFQIASPRCEF